MTTGKKIQIADYNAIRAKVIGVVGAGSADGGYGYPVKSTAVTTTSRVRKSDWTSLGNDITNARRHQTGPPDPTLLDLAVGSKVKSNSTTQYYTRYDTLADQVVADRNLVNTTSTINITAVTREFANGDPWYNLITATVTVEFDSEDNARSYFNTGGEIRFSSSRTDPSGANPDVDRARQNTSWSTLLTNITNGTGGYTVPRFGGRLPSAGVTPANGNNYYRLTGIYQQWYIASPPTTAPGTQLPDFGVNDFVIKARFPEIANRARIEFRVEWQDNFQADYKFDDGITGQFSLGVTLIKPISFALAGFDGSFTAIETPEVTIDAISNTADTGPAVPAAPSYGFTQDKTAINETPGGIGNVVTYTVNTTNVVDGAVLYWRLFGTATASDFDPQTLTGSASVTNPYPDPAGTAAIAITARADATSEAATSPENFTLRVYDTEAGRNADTIERRVVNTTPVTINDTSKGTPTIAVTVLAGATTISDNAEVNEGTAITYNLATTNIPNGVSISYAFSGQASTADYTPADSSGTISNLSSDGGYTGTSQLQRTIVNDLSPFQSPLVPGAEPDPETMTVTFSYTGAVSAVRTIRIRDTSFAPAPAVTVTGAQWSPGSVYIGNSSTLSYTANNVSRAESILAGGTIINNTNAPSGSTTINFSQSFGTGSGTSFPNSGTYPTTIRGYSAFQPGTTVDSSSFNLQVLSVPTPQVNSVSFSPATYTAPGSSTLSWSTTNANYVSISLPSFSGDYPASSSLVVNYSTSGTNTAVVTPRNGPAPGFPAALTPQTYTGPSGSASVTVSTTTPPPPPAHKISFGFSTSYNPTTLGFSVIRGAFTWSTKTHSLGMSGSGPGAVYDVPASSRIFVNSTTGSGNVTVSAINASPQSGGVINYYNDVGTFPAFTSWQYTINSMTTTGGGPSSTTKFCPNGIATAYPWYLRVRASGFATNLNFTASWTDGGVAQTRTIFGQWVASYDDETFRQEATTVSADFIGGEAWTSLHQSYAIQIKNGVYESDGTYTINDPSTPSGTATRYGLHRTAEIFGPYYWARECINNAYLPTSRTFYTNFFNGTSGNDTTRSLFQGKFFDDGGIREFGSWRDRY